MLRGFALSTLVHASVLAMAMMSWPQPESECDRAIEKLRRENPGIRSIEIVMALPHCVSSADLPIDFEEVGLVSNVTELRKAPDPKEDAVQPEAEPDLPETPPEAPPEEAAPEQAEPVPDPRTQQPEIKKPEPVKKPEPKKPEPLVKKDPPKKDPPKKDDLDFLNDFENVLKDKRTERPRKTATEPDDRPVLGNADRDRDGAGDKTGNIGSLQAMLKRQIERCWDGVDDLPPEAQIDVELRVKLNPNGTIDGSIERVSPTGRLDRFKEIAVQKAFAAVRNCAAYGLPKESYEEWKDIVVSIGPRRG